MSSEPNETRPVNPVPATRLSRSRLARFRYEAGFSSAKLAAFDLGVSAIYLHEIEAGRNPLPQHLADRMATLYRVDALELGKAAEKDRVERLHRTLEMLGENPDLPPVETPE